MVRLQNVALVTGFMTSIVSIKKLNEGGVYWNSEYPNKMLKDRKDWCTLYEVDDHWVFQNLKTIPKAAFTVDGNKTKGRPKSLAPLKCTHTDKYIHRILGHVSKDTISYVQEASANITIDNSVLCLITIQYENYALSKA